MHARFVRVISLALPLVVVWGCASMTRPATFGLNPSDAQLVRETCSEVMGLREGLLEFDACGSSLAESVALQRESDRIALANEHCHDEGYVLGTAEMAKCVLIFRRAGSAEAYATAVAEPQSKKSYLLVSRVQQNERVQLSCAQLGLHPDSDRFRFCVTHLKDSIVRAQMPEPL